MTETATGKTLGVELRPNGAEAAVFSAHASAVYVCTFDGEVESARITLEPDGNGVHRGFIPGAAEGTRYGLRVDGPYDPGQGHRFDVSKLLTDPYASRLDRPYRLHPSMFARGQDSAPYAPKCVIETLPFGDPGHTRVGWDRTILYELNIRGFTKLRTDIPEALRGRFAALAEPPVIEHFKGLGVTSIELMPADAFVDERHLPPLGLTNAWGYNPVIWGAPDPRLAPEGWPEVRRATDALHAAGFEVILDVVLNHNGESDEFGPTLSFRGLDNASYFRLRPEDLSLYINDMGCGNCVALDRPANVALAVAALRRWMIVGGIDGFRFDLATAIGRRPYGFDLQAPLFAAMADDPILGRAKMIAEPWDIGPGGYRLGGFPAAWGEWNDRFRDSTRRFWRGDGQMRGELASRLSGSRDVFPQAPASTKSINFVVAHDGFTLADLVSYAHKRNEANGEQNRDGGNENYSWNHYVEGPTDDPNVLVWRARDMRNLLATLFVARGVPMLAMGAELGHSQQGNNNAYAQDNAISWIDWAKADLGLAAFVGRLARIRAEHLSLHSTAWLEARAFDDTGEVDVEWRDAEVPMSTGSHWDSPYGDALVVVLAAPGSDRVTVALNRGPPTSLRLPENGPGKLWRLLLDTSDDSRADAPTDLSDRIPLPARTTLILVEADVATSPHGGRPPEARDVDALAAAAGIAPEWWDVGGKHTRVSAATKLALLDAMRLPARSAPQARESLDRLIEETSARRLPPSLTFTQDSVLRAPLRFDASETPRVSDYHLTLEDGRALSGAALDIGSQRRDLPNGREIVERHFELPDLPVGRHRLEADGVICQLTIAPVEAYGAEAMRRRRFGVSGQLYALRRAEGDQGIGDFTTLGLAGAGAGKQGAAYFGVSPMHQLFAGDRRRASPYHPSDRRFLDPMLIDTLADDGLPSDEEAEAGLGARIAEFAALAALPSVDYPRVWSAKRLQLQCRFAAFLRGRAAHPQAPIFAQFDDFVRSGGETLQRFAVFEAISRERAGEDWRRWPRALRDADPAALASAAQARDYDVRFTLFCQWLADRQLAAAAACAKAGGLGIGFYRDLAVGSAPDGAESWARAGEFAIGATVGAPPDPFSAQGQVWNLPAPDPIASGRQGWRGFAELLAANMRHAGLLRIDHAMGLTRLFVIPDGAKPAEGAYVAYPADDLIGQTTLESQRHRCMVIGEDLGTVPEGFREKLTRANISGMRVLYFERQGVGFLSPKDYPPHSVACITTHDLPTLEGWWRGADIIERRELRMIAEEEATRALNERDSEKRALVDAVKASGPFAHDPLLEAPLDDDLAAAIHAFVADSGSALASAQCDDLAGETVATNLPGTDHERPNWRHRTAAAVETLFEAPRARAILEAMRGVRG